MGRHKSTEQKWIEAVVFIVIIALLATLLIAAWLSDKEMMK
jgi:hypothetical protein